MSIKLKEIPLTDETKTAGEEIIKGADPEAEVRWMKSLISRTYFVSVRCKNGLRDDPTVKEKIAVLGRKSGLHFILTE